MVTAATLLDSAIPVAPTVYHSNHILSKQRRQGVVNSKEDSSAESRHKSSVVAPRRARNLTRTADSFIRSFVRATSLLIYVKRIQRPASKQAIMTPRKRKATLSASSSAHNSSKTRTKKWGRVTPVTSTTPCTLLQLTVVIMSAMIALTTNTLWSSTAAAAAFTVPGAPSPAHRRRPHDVVRGDQQLQQRPIQDDDDDSGAGPPLLWMPRQQDDENDTKTATTATATNPRTSLRAKLGLSLNDDETGASSTLVPLPNSSSSSRNSSIKVVGHRGAMYEFLENTREGFVHCAQLGCHAVELDVFFLPRDGSVVVFHGTDDDNNNEHEQHVPRGLLREYCLGYDKNDDDDDATTSQQHTSIVDLTYPESQLLRFNPEFAEFGCPPSAIERGRIPLLQDVLLDLQAFPDLEIKIELKGHGTVQPVLDIVERLQMQRQCSYSSFDLPQLQQLRQLRPDATLYRTGALFAGVPPANFLTLARDCGASEIHLQYDECTTACIAAIHQAGFTSMAWFRGPRGMQSDARYKYTDDMHNGEDERCYQALVETGVHQICCNRPNVLLQLLLTEEQQQQQTWTVG